LQLSDKTKIKSHLLGVANQFCNSSRQTCFSSHVRVRSSGLF